jgi:release factor glutamine methyltransferase
MDLIRRRGTGEPVAYLTARKEWFGIELEVRGGVLIPRPETELVVEAAIELARETNSRLIADIGTGAGAIAIALAYELPWARIVAVDCDSAAVELAQRNVLRQELSNRVTVRQGDLLVPLLSRPDLIVANLPYLSDDQVANLPVEVRFEPLAALSGGRTGLGVYERLLRQIRERSWRLPIVCEIDGDQGKELMELATDLLPGYSVDIRMDYSDFDRIAILTPSLQSSLPVRATG